MVRHRGWDIVRLEKLNLLNEDLVRQMVFISAHARFTRVYILHLSMAVNATNEVIWMFYDFYSWSLHAMNHIEPIPGLVGCSLTVPKTNSGQGHKLFYCMGPESPMLGKRCQLIVVSLSLLEIPDSYSMLASLNATFTLVGPCPLPLFLAVGPCPHFKSMSDHVPTLASDYVVSDLITITSLTSPITIN